MKMDDHSLRSCGPLLNVVGKFSNKFAKVNRSVSLLGQPTNIDGRIGVCRYGTAGPERMKKT